MKQLIFLLLPIAVFAQYWGERPNEKSFEQSSLYFNSYYLNPFGIHQFSDVSLGLIDDPFLRTHLNPASIPKDSLEANQMYLDFRGDRTEIELTGYYPTNPYHDYASSVYYRPDPRWYTVTRTEPQPLFSFGLNKKFADNLYFSGSYQFVFKEEGYYQTPTWIYNSRYGMDEKGGSLVDDASVPITDRSAGEDEMHTKGHLLALNLAYRLSNTLRLGVNANSITHERSGAYANLRADRYSENNEDDEWFNSYSKERNNTYKHLDLGAGVQYDVSDDLTAGIKLSYLKGKADQEYLEKDSSRYYSKWTNDTYHSMHSSFRYGTTEQEWNHDGHTATGMVHLDYQLSKSRSLHFYYQYTKQDLDLDNRSSIIDTSEYSGDYNHSNYQSIYNSWYRMYDHRSATGLSKMDGWQAMFTFRWFETERTRVHFGIFFSDKHYSKHTNEPVVALNRSHYYHQYTNDGVTEDYTRNYRLYEDKRLEWEITTTKQTMQLPVMMQFDFNKNWMMTLAVNRIWNYWRIEEKTIAYFNEREEDDNGEYEHNTNFGERWAEPDRIISEDTIAFLSGLSIKISPKFQINIMASPEFEPQWRVSQWWLGFRAGL